MGLGSKVCRLNGDAYSLQNSPSLFATFQDGASFSYATAGMGADVVEEC